MAYWIWYPGDFEIYHGMMQNFSREERGYEWPAYWRVDDCHHNVKFSLTRAFESPTPMTVTAHGIGHVCIHWKPEEYKGQDIPPYFYRSAKYPLGREFEVPASEEVTIDVIVGNRNGLPSMYAEGACESGPDWVVTELSTPALPVGYDAMFTKKEQNPMNFEYAHEILSPTEVTRVQGGLLYDFGREITAAMILTKTSGDAAEMDICYGESRTEALDVDLCYFKDHVLVSAEPQTTAIRAFRYVFIPQEAAALQVDVKADFTYVDFAHRSSFSCNDALVNRIWDVSDYTLRLASGVFFIDGVKRDRWIWSGDAYQSYLVNRYAFFDAGVSRRTILALRGKDPITQHINTIVDYSMYWLMSIGDYYMMTADKDFVRQVYPKMKSMMAYLLEQVDEHGFIYGRPGDWIFIDWSDIDKEGTVCAEQMLLARCYQAMDTAAALVGDDSVDYSKRFTALLANIRKYFWNAQLGAFIDSFESGKAHVSRHANIFAVLFDYATPEETKSILDNVLFNDQVPAITTPYFKFYELEALSKLGCLPEVLAQMKDYWGGMLDKGATTIWEEYNPQDSEDVQYDMYGDKYFKSLCHAWGASPMYLLGRYFVGLQPTAPGYAAFEIAPTDIFDHYEATFAVGEGDIHVRYDQGQLEVTADKDGGTLIWKDQRHVLPAGEKVIL